ncbi:MAG: ABC transporter permease subunit [Candidatus Coatesbacteria bacterium]|nr:ABC transporter permease subunit [Candidatus Coatesbacteria bacterium]
MKVLSRIMDNPILALELRQRVRNPAILVTIVIYILIIAFIFLVSYLDIETKRQNNVVLGQQFFYTIAYAEFILLSVYLSIITSQAIISELKAKTFGFILSSPMSAGSIIFGKLASTFILIVLLLSVSLPLKIIGTVVGGIDIFTIISFMFFMLIYSIFLSSIGVFISSVVRNNRSAIFFMLGFNFCIFIISLIFVEVFRYYSKTQNLPLISVLFPINIIYGFANGSVNFLIFKFKIPFWIPTILILGLFIVFFNYLSARSIKRFDEPITLLPPKYNLGIIACFLLILFLSFWSSYSRTTSMITSSRISYSNIDNTLRFFSAYFLYVSIFFISAIPFFPIIPRCKSNELLPNDRYLFPLNLPRNAGDDIVKFLLYFSVILIGPFLSIIFFPKTFTGQDKIVFYYFLMTFLSLVPYVTFSRLLQNIMPKKRIAVTLYFILVLVYLGITFILNSTKALKSPADFILGSMNALYFVSDTIKDGFSNQGIIKTDFILYTSVNLSICFFTSVFWILLDIALKPLNQLKIYLPNLEDY